MSTYKYNPLLKYWFDIVWAASAPSIVQSISFWVNQAAHWFSVLDAAYFNWTTWQKAVSSDVDKMATHVVTSVADVDNFSLWQIWRFNIASHWLADWYYFVSDTTPWVLTAIEPTPYSNPVLRTEWSDYVHLLSYRPYKKLSEVADFVFNSWWASAWDTITHSLWKYPYITITDLAWNVIDLWLQYIDVNTVATTAVPSTHYIAYFIVSTDYLAYNQPAAVITDTIVHNFWRNPLVTVTDLSWNLIVANVTHIDVNTVQIDFGTATAFNLYLN